MSNIDILRERAENMRKAPTYHEKKFADRLELSGIFYKSQWVIGRYIVDFLIGKIVVEIDGYSHFETFQAAYDEERTKYLESKGYKVIRVRNNDVVSFDMNRLKPPKKYKSGKCQKSQRQPSKERLAEINRRRSAEMQKHIESIKQKSKRKTIEITPPIHIKTDNKTRFSYSEMRKHI